MLMVEFFNRIGSLLLLEEVLATRETIGSQADKV
jgi:hypothetical protein